MGSNQWVGARLDGRTIAQLDREAEARGISRSEAVRRAVERWTKTAMDEDEERLTKSQANHRQLMNRLDYIVGMIREQDRMAGHLEEYEVRRRQTPAGQTRTGQAPSRDSQESQEPPASQEEPAGTGDGQRREPPRWRPQREQESQPRLEPEEDAPELEESEEEPESGPRQGALAEARKRARRRLG